MEENRPEGFAAFVLPEAVRRRLRTSTASENLNRDLRRRTAVAGVFPNEASSSRLVTALLIEISEDPETSKAYLASQNVSPPKTKRHTANPKS
jgi:transposase-like protein